MNLLNLKKIGSWPSLVADVEEAAASSSSDIKAIKDSDADDQPDGELVPLPQPELEEEAADGPAQHPGSLRPATDL